MKKRGTKGITTMIAVVLVIVTLVLGLVVGMLIEGTQRILYPPTELEEEIADLTATKEALVPILLGEAQFIQDTLNVTFDLTLTGEIELGAVLSLTGDLATFGENEQVAAEFAASQANVLLKALGANWTVKIVPEDTVTDPAICLEKVESLAARGIELIIGPLSSAEVRAIKGYCDANKILAISQSSTAPDLAIAGDYIYRFCPTDKLGQGPACGRLLYDEGIRYVITFTREDAWGVGLEEAGELKFEALGGTFLEGIRYTPDKTEFSSEAGLLATKVSNALAQADINENNLAVWAISFEEAKTVFTAMKDYPVLDDVKWFGSDGDAGSGKLLTDPAVADWAISVEFPCTIFRPAHTWKWQMVRDHGRAVLGREPESYSYAIYDIVWALTYSLLVTDEYDAAAVRDVIANVTEVWFGASGQIELDEFGDRTAGDYDIWKIKEIAAGEYDWEIVGAYILATDSIEWFL